MKNNKKKKVQAWLVCSEGVVQDTYPTEREAREEAARWYKPSVFHLVTPDPAETSLVRIALKSFRKNGSITEENIQRIGRAVERIRQENR